MQAKVALDAFRAQGLTKATGLGGLGAGLGLAGAIPGFDPALAGGLSAAGGVSTLAGQFADPRVLQSLRGGATGVGIPNLGLTAGNLGTLATGGNMAGLGLGTAGSIAGLTGADPRLSFGLGAAGTLAGGIGAAASVPAATAAVAGGTAAAGLGGALGGAGMTGGLVGLVMLPSMVSNFIAAKNRADTLRFNATQLGRIFQGLRDDPSLTQLIAGAQPTPQNVGGALESGAYAASRGLKHGGDVGQVQSLNRQLAGMLQAAGRSQEAVAAAKRGIGWMRMGDVPEEQAAPGATTLSDVLRSVGIDWYPDAPKSAGYQANFPLQAAGIAPPTPGPGAQQQYQAAVERLQPDYQPPPRDPRINWDQPEQRFVDPRSRQYV